MNNKINNIKNKNKKIKNKRLINIKKIKKEYNENYIK